MYIPGRLRTASRPSRTVMSLAPYSRGVAASAGVSGVRASSAMVPAAGISVLSLATGAVDSSVLDDGRPVSLHMEVPCQQAQTYGADDVLTLGIRSPRTG